MKEIESRQIRVFISSTFRDMKEERDYLVKFTFPQLRKLCESRGVVWGEVDLRWGVTDEQKAEGKVLPICLEEIKRCRPYFIGLLGERYGWIPDAIPPEVIEREPWLTEHVHGRKSVTELEILHGVLNNPDMAKHAFFYFRDPAYVQSLPPDRKKDFATEDSGSTEKLKNLKDRIRKSHFPVREKYHDPKALGDLVLAHLTAVIDTLWPEGSQLDPLDREAMDHEAYAQSRERVYIGRPEYFAKLDAHAEGSGDQPLVILGESGCGKSALLANWAKHYRAEHPKTLVLQHYIGATPYSADWAAMLRRFMGEFKRHMEIREDIPDKSDTLRSAFPNWLHMAAAKGRIVLVLDALNQLEDRDGAPDLVWLPPVMPQNLRLIVSTLPGLPLDEIKKRAWPSLEVEPLTQPEREKLTGEYLAQYAKVLSPARVQRIAAAPQSANPLYLRVLLDELRVFGEHERLEERIGYYLQAESPRDLYRKVITRWEEDYGTGTTLVCDTLSLLWAARRGLSETELLHTISKDGQLLPHAIWSPLYLAMSDALVSRAGLLTFAHDFLRTATRDAYLSAEIDRRRAHLRLADYFAEVTPVRCIDEYPYHLQQAQDWERLASALANLDLFDCAWAQSREDHSREYEWIRYWGSLRGRCNAADYYRAAIDAKKCTEGETIGLAMSQHNISILLEHMGDFSSAIEFAEHSLAAKERIRILEDIGPDANNPSNSVASYQGRVFERSCSDPNTLCNLAGFYLRVGRHSTAKRLAKRSLHINERLYGPNHEYVAYSLCTLADVYADRCRLRRALPLYQRVLSIWERNRGPSHSEVANMLNTIACIYIRSRRYSEAKDLLTRDLTIVEGLYGRVSPLGATIVGNLGAVCNRKGDRNEARALLERAIAMNELCELPDYEVCPPLVELADLCRKEGKLDEAIGICHRVLAIKERVYGNNSVATSLTLITLAGLNWQVGSYRKAVNLAIRGNALFTIRYFLASAFNLAMFTICAVVVLIGGLSITLSSDLGVSTICGSLVIALGVSWLWLSLKALMVRKVEDRRKS
jgi:nephrocystin-3